jgi:DNA-binding GntR family transcriptional regulator
MSGENSSLAGSAYSVVRQRILRGELPIGKVISRRKIAGELGMSFLPVSEALLRLEFEGLLESRPRAGTRVRIPTRQDVKGHYVVREALEVHAARLFAEVATADELAELTKLAIRVDTAASQSGPGSLLYPTLHAKLHRRIAECARCHKLSEAIEQTHALSSTWLCVPAGAPTGRTVSRHQELLQALSSRNPEVAGETMREHIASSLHHALNRLEPFFRLRKAIGSSYSRDPKKRTAKSEAAG